MSTESKVLIIGYGTVGHNLAEELKPLKDRIAITDKYKGIEINTSGDYELGIVCVDTPLVDGELDVTEVENAIRENDCRVYMIKSTCPIGTVTRLKKETGKHIIFSPEYYGGTQHCNNFEFNFTILGGDKEDCIKVVQILQKVYDARHTFRITTAETAEMAKFMENCWLAMKVSFCTSMYESAEKMGVEYEELR